MMEEHQKNINTLRFMLSTLMVRQSSWELNDNEKKMTKEGIKALQAAIDSMSVQILA